MWRSKHRSWEESRKGEGEEVKEELITLQYLNSTHHRWVEFHIPFYIIWMWLCSFCQKGVEQAWLYFYYSGLELSACVCVLGGGDYSPLSFIYRSPREDYVALWPLPTHAGARKIYPPSPRHRRWKMFWLGGGGGKILYRLRSISLIVC